MRILMPECSPSVNLGLTGFAAEVARLVVTDWQKFLSSQQPSGNCSSKVSRRCLPMKVMSSVSESLR